MALFDRRQFSDADVQALSRAVVEESESLKEGFPHRNSQKRRKQSTLKTIQTLQISGNISV